MFKNQTLQIICFTLLANSLAFSNMPPNGFRRFKADYFVETGSSNGHSINQAINAGFKEIHSIEISNKVAHWTTQRFKEFNHVHVWQGDSGSILYDVIRNIDGKITFWLTANNHSSTINIEHKPILRELDQIKRHHIKNHTILIDSIKDTETQLFDYISTDVIIAKIRDINPDYQIYFIAGGDYSESDKHILVAEAGEYKSRYLDSAIIQKIDKKEVGIILELGAYEGRDSVELFKHYQCPIIGFECAPESIKKCRSAIQHYPYIKLIEKACWNSTQPITFYYCPPHPEASSCLFFDYETIARRDREPIPQVVKQFPTKSIKVNAVRLDDWLIQNNIDHIDMICMSTQGSTAAILEGLGAYLKIVKYVVTQVMYHRTYKDEALFPEINNFMEQHGFTAFNATPNEFSNYVIFVRNDLCR